MQGIEPIESDAGFDLGPPASRVSLKSVNLDYTKWIMLRIILSAIVPTEDSTLRTSSKRRSRIGGLRFLRSIYAGIVFLIRSSLDGSILAVARKFRRFALDESIAQAVRGHLEIVRALDGPGVRAIVDRHPNYLNKYVGRYMAKRFDKSARRSILKFHHEYLAERVVDAFYEQVLTSRPALWTLERDECRYAIALSFNSKWHSEGDLSLILTQDEFQLYEVAFTIVQGRLIGFAPQPVLFVGRIQGAVRQADAIKAATRACNDVAPSHLLMVALPAVAGALGIDVIAGVGSREQISEDGGAKWHFDYDQFWETFPVKELGASIYELPVPLPEKPLSEIKQSHRRRTRQKREFKKKVGAEIEAVFQEKFSRVKPIQ